MVCEKDKVSDALTFTLRTVTIALAICLSCIAPFAFAQAPPELPGYSVSTSVGYTTTTGQADNAMFLSLAVPLKTVFMNSALGTMTLSARVDNFWATASGVNIILAGPEERFQFSKSGFLNGMVFQPYVNEMAGISRQACIGTSNCPTGTNTHTRVAYKPIGVGLDALLSSNVTWRLLQIDYIRSSLLPNGHLVVSNAAQISTGFQFHF